MFSTTLLSIPTPSTSTGHYRYLPASIDIPSHPHTAPLPVCHPNVNYSTLPVRASAPPGRIRPLPPLPTSPPPASAKSAKESPPVSTVRPLPSIPRLSIVLPSPPQSPPPTILELPNPHSLPPSPNITIRPLPNPHPHNVEPANPHSPVNAELPECPPLTISRRSTSAFTVSSVKPLSVITTSPSTIHFRSSIASSLFSTSPLTPLTPTVLRRPTLTTAKRRRLSKAQRFLGEIVPVELVMGPSSATEKRKSLVVSARADFHIWKKNNRRHRRNLALKQKQRRTNAVAVDSEAGSTFSPVGGEVRLGTKAETRLECANEPRSSYSRRVSQNNVWLYERGGQRWVENDFHNVIHALRSL